MEVIDGTVQPPGSLIPIWPDLLRGASLRTTPDWVKLTLPNSQTWADVCVQTDTIPTRDLLCWSVRVIPFPLHPSLSPSGRWWGSVSSEQEYLHFSRSGSLPPCSHRPQLSLWTQILALSGIITPSQKYLLSSELPELCCDFCSAVIGKTEDKQ